MKLTIPWHLHIESGNWWGNYVTKGGRAQRAAKASQHRNQAWTVVTSALRNEGWETPVEAAKITIKVRRPRLFDSDNLVWAVKHLRDGIACALAGLLPKQKAPDGPGDPYEWFVEGSKGKDLVTIEIEAE